MSNASRQSKLPCPAGVFPALVTPFDKDEGVDESTFRGLIRHVIDDVDGLAPCGTTGEFPYLSVEEQRHLSVLACCVFRPGPYAARNTQHVMKESQ